MMDSAIFCKVFWDRKGKRQEILEPDISLAKSLFARRSRVALLKKGARAVIPGISHSGSALSTKMSRVSFDKKGASPASFTRLLTWSFSRAREFKVSRLKKGARETIPLMSHSGSALSIKVSRVSFDKKGASPVSYIRLLRWILSRA